MINVYCSISKQFRQYKDQIDSWAIDEFSERDCPLSLDFYDWRNETSYKNPGCHIGGSDVIFVYVKEVSDKIGKGSYKEIEYGLTNGIPVFLVNRRGSLFPFDMSRDSKRHQPDEGDYRNYARVPFSCMRWNSFFTIVRKGKGLFRNVFINYNSGDHSLYEEILGSEIVYQKEKTSIKKKKPLLSTHQELLLLTS